MVTRVFTIGVYGKAETEFFGDLIKAHVDTFCDIRRRRGVRGSQYAFVNSTYLQRALADRGVKYKYFPDLAPSNDIRKAQQLTDAQQGILKRNRQQLGDEFSADTLRRFSGTSIPQNSAKHLNWTPKTSSCSASKETPRHAIVLLSRSGWREIGEFQWSTYKWQKRQW